LAQFRQIQRKAANRNVEKQNSTPRKKILNAVNGKWGFCLKSGGIQEKPAQRIRVHSRVIILHYLKYIKEQNEPAVSKV